MILPSKHIQESDALLGVGAVVIRELEGRTQTVTSLWDILREHRSVGTFERFVLALDMLYITGVVHIRDGMLERVTR